MDALFFYGIKVTDRSVEGKIIGDSLPIEKTSIAINHSRCLTSMFNIVTMLNNLGSKDRAKRWLRAQVWVENAYTGGGVEMFKKLHGETLDSHDMSGLL